MVEALSDHTHCAITSNAPILHLIEEEDPAMLLSEELEALPARRRGASASRQDKYELRLTKIEPIALYLACRSALRQALDESAHPPNDGGRPGYRPSVERRCGGRIADRTKICRIW